MTIPWFPGPGGNMVVPQGYEDPHNYTAPLAPGLGSFPDEYAGVVARNIPRRIVNSATLAAVNTTGTVAASIIALFAGQVISNIQVVTGTTAAVAPTHFWLGLADANVNVLGTTADQLTAAIGASTVFKLALTTPVVIPTSGFYYVLACTSATTTAPTLCGTSAIAGLNGGSPVVAGTVGTQVSPPATGTQLGGGTVGSNGNMGFAAWLS